MHPAIRPALVLVALFPSTTGCQFGPLTVRDAELYGQPGAWDPLPADAPVPFYPWAQLPRPFVVIARLVARTTSLWLFTGAQGFDDLDEALRERARELGGNALVILNERDRGLQSKRRVAAVVRCGLQMDNEQHKRGVARFFGVDTSQAAEELGRYVGEGLETAEPTKR